ncbi:MAG: hypothetical protein ABEL51_03600 [Salinibacter sp.]
MKTFHYRVLAILWTVGIVLAMSLPTGNFGTVDSALGLDKLAHVVLFAGFGGLWLRGLCPPEEHGLSSCFRRRGGMLFVAGIFFAAGTEVYQHLLPIQRLADPYDVTADFVGFSLAFVGYFLYHVRRPNRTSA